MSKITPKRIAVDGLLAALFFVLTLFSVVIGGVKLTFHSLGVIIAAMAFGPVDAFLVGFIGGFLEQMLRYGFTATTFLWILPLAIQGLVIGLGTVVFRRQMSLDAILGEKRVTAYYAVCMAAAVLTSCLNTLAYYVDSKLYGYYTYALIFGVFGFRVLTGLLVAVLCGTAALAVLAALRRANLIPDRGNGEGRFS